MGQRHQLLVIAKVLGRYRSLAAVDHNWLYGQSALRACHRLVQIFQDPHNRHALALEIANAERLREDDWEREEERSTSAFPFITTCLVIGTSFGFPTGDASNTTPEPWNMDFDGCATGNNDGVTIIDITQPESVRYCFVIWYAHDQAGLPQTDGKFMTPLRGAEYLSIYYKKEEWTSTMQELSGTLDKFPLITASILNETWPRKDWELRAERGLEPVAKDEPTQTNVKSGHANLASLSMEKSIERVLNEEDELLQYVELLPSFKPSLKTYLYTHPSVVGKKRFGFAMLQKVLKGDNILDLHPFSQLSADQVIQLIEGAAHHPSLDMLDISGNSNITVLDMQKILGKTSVNTLYVWNNPALPEKQLQSFVRGGLVKKILHPGAFRAAFVEYETRLSLLYSADPDYEEYEDNDSTNSDNTSLPLSPFRQLIWACSAHYLKMGEKNKRWKPFHDQRLEHFYFSNSTDATVVPLSDVPLSASQLLSSLWKLISCMTKYRQQYHFGMSNSIALALSFGLAMHHEESPWAVYPIPTEYYIRARAAYHNHVAACLDHRKMHPLADGEWTVIVFHERDIVEPNDEPGEGWKRGPEKDCFHLAFVTRQDGKMQIRDAKEFLKETGAEHYAAKWEKHIAEVKRADDDKDVDEENFGPGVEVRRCDEETVGNILATLETVEREMLERLRRAPSS